MNKGLQRLHPKTWECSSWALWWRLNTLQLKTVFWDCLHRSLGLMMRRIWPVVQASTTASLLMSVLHSASMFLTKWPIRRSQICPGFPYQPWLSFWLSLMPFQSKSGTICTSTGRPFFDSRKMKKLGILIECIRSSKNNYTWSGQRKHNKARKMVQKNTKKTIDHVANTSTTTNWYINNRWIILDVVNSGCK